MSARPDADAWPADSTDSGAPSEGGAPASITGGDAQGDGAGEPSLGALADASTDDILAMLSTYRSWEPLSANAVDISSQIFALCRLPTAAEERFVSSAHTHFALRYWANAAGARGFFAPDATPFAEGAVIVKEKFAGTDRTLGGGGATPAALGVMVKRHPGFDTAHGDWEFAYWTSESGLTRDTDGSCGSCHASSAADDFVFRDQSWRRDL